MSEHPSRRDMLRGATALGALGAPAAEHQHPAVKPAAMPKPAVLTPHEYQTVARLAEIAIPGAQAGGAPEYIDLMCSGSKRMAAFYTGGLAWVDAQMRARCGKDFVAAAPREQTALLDLIAYRKNLTPELSPGIRFFETLRRMAADAYYTSKAGIDELGFRGNGVRSSFDVPAEAIDYALKRSPFSGG